ncbi:MAG: M16 family metallopeptidase, partial [Vicinamibacterales bacterium]
DAGALDIQRRVLIEELHHRSRRRVRPVACEHLHRALFHERHPYHRPPAGQPDDIRALTSTDVEELVASRFSPRRAVLVLAGGVSAETAAGCVDRTFGTLAASAERAREPVVDSQPQPATQSRRVAADVAGTHAFVAWSVDGLGQGEWYLASLLMRGLSAGRSSPLAEALVERAGLAREVRGHLVSMRDASTLAFAAVAAAGVASERLEQGLVEAIDRLLASGLSPGGLRRARSRAWIDHYLAIQKIERRADLCASFSCCLDAPERLETEPLRYLIPDRDALAAFASRLRQRQARATLSLIPRMEAA